MDIQLKKKKIRNAAAMDGCRNRIGGRSAGWNVFLCQPGHGGAY